MWFWCPYAGIVVTFTPIELVRRVHHERAAAEEADRLGHRLDAPVTEECQPRGVARIVVQRQDRPGGQAELLAELAGQLLGEGALVEGGLGQRGGRIPLADPGRR